MDFTEYTFNTMVNDRVVMKCKTHPMANDLVTLEIDNDGYAYMICQGDSPETAHMIKEMS